jgi:hypothetical protein
MYTLSTSNLSTIIQCYEIMTLPFVKLWTSFKQLLQLVIPFEKEVEDFDAHQLIPVLIGKIFI